MPYFPIRARVMEPAQEAGIVATPRPEDDHHHGHVEEESSRNQRVRVKNRRKRYLDTHPDYFGASLELADPLLYDRLIRRFQTPAEREAEGRDKGYSGVLEADLVRSEAKLQALARTSTPGAGSFEVTYVRGPGGEIIPEDGDEVPASKEEGRRRWEDEMRMRFLRGDDGDFEYAAVDESEEFDDVRLEEREAEERWFEEEEPTFLEKEDGGDTEPRGETGVQDF